MKTEREISPTYRAIYLVLRKIPRGKVATYGQIARLAGFPGQARLVGYALHAYSDTRVPWHRVVNAKGESSLPDPSGRDLQQALLEREGVTFNAAGRVDLKRYGWKK